MTRPYTTKQKSETHRIIIGQNLLFVTEIQPETNTVILGEIADLNREEMLVRNINLVKYAAIPDQLEVLSKVRYKDPGTMSTIVQDGKEMRVHFHTPVKSVAPGQSAVFYEGDDVVAGGFIEKSTIS